MSPLSVGLTSVDGGDMHSVQTDGIRAIRGARTKDTLMRPRSISPRLHTQNVATSTIEPGDDYDLIAAPDAPKTLKHLQLEDQPSLGCAFVGLVGSQFEIG
jgi:hypothetical protein